VNPPQDLTPEAIRRAVLGHSLQHPLVVYPAAVGLLGGLGAAFVAGTPLLVGVSVFAGVAALAGFSTNFWGRHDRIAGAYLASVRERLTRERTEQITDLAEDLKNVGAHDAQRQLERFVDKISTFQAVLSERLSPNELTFARFSAIAEAVFLAGVDNLRAIHLALKSLEAVDEGYVSQRLQLLEKSRASDHTSTAVQGLRDQLQHAHTLRERANHRLGQNELAMAELDRATAAVGEMKTGADRPSLDMEAAMQELTRLAQRSSAY
jgi:hypothetical protein